MSTGLIVNGDDEGERGALAKKSFGVVILDEAHKARASRGMQGRDPPKPNNLLEFLRTVARNAQNVILGTATPIQLDAVELWDLLVRAEPRRAAGSRHAIRRRGMDARGLDPIPHRARPWPTNDTNRWGLFRNPLPPAAEHAVFRDIRDDAGAAVTRGARAALRRPWRPDIRADFLTISRPGRAPQSRSSVASCGERDRCWKSAAC